MRFPIVGTGLLAAIFAASTTVIFAGQPPKDASANGDPYKTVQVDVNGKKVPVRVAETNPYAHIKEHAPDPSGKYHPDQYSFSTTSPLANKTYAPPIDTLAKSDPEFTNAEHNKYTTKAYADPSLAGKVTGLDTKSTFTTSAYSTKSSGLDKTYVTAANTDADLNRSAQLADNAGKDFNRDAILGGKDETKLFTENTMSHKQYLGPGAQNVPEDVTIKDNTVLSRMSGVPNRPLSIDEVRNLINHGATPNTDDKASIPSKPLNDPDYKPEPLRDNPSLSLPSTFDLAPKNSAPADDDDKNDPVPPPGTMGAPIPPENTAPLPQR